MVSSRAVSIGAFNRALDRPPEDQTSKSAEIFPVVPYNRIHRYRLDLLCPTSVARIATVAADLRDPCSTSGFMSEYRLFATHQSASDTPRMSRVSGSSSALGGAPPTSLIETVWTGSPRIRMPTCSTSTILAMRYSAPRYQTVSPIAYPIT